MASTYRPPGVYPQMEQIAQVNLDDTARIPVIIGRGTSSILVSAEKVLHQAAIYGADHLLNDVYKPSGGTDQIISVGNYPGHIKYILGTDFSVVDNGDGTSGIFWLPTGDAPTVGAYYYVTYKKSVPDTQYDYHFYTDANQIILNHGDEQTAYESVTTGGILALRNGAIGVGIIQVHPRDNENPTEADLYTAYVNTIPILETLDTRYCRYIVPMTVDDDVGTTPFPEFIDHVYDMSTQNTRRWRMLIRGMSHQIATANTTVAQE
jgi:hypothetical protein